MQTQSPSPGVPFFWRLWVLWPWEGAGTLRQGTSLQDRSLLQNSDSTALTQRKTEAAGVTGASSILQTELRISSPKPEPAAELGTARQGREDPG